MHISYTSPLRSYPISPSSVYTWKPLFLCASPSCIFWHFLTHLFAFLQWLYICSHWYNYCADHVCVLLSKRAFTFVKHQREFYFSGIGIGTFFLDETESYWKSGKSAAQGTHLCLISIEHKIVSDFLVSKIIMS